MRHPHIVGDTNTVVDEVTRKYTEGDEHLVEVQVMNQNQSGLSTALVTAIVSLPSRR
ncbi:MAG: hypothetical protein P8J55_07350 [Pseudomonadales bacterium]|nr:hypothetical protein [Pseudomonadales bacterium]